MVRRDEFLGRVGGRKGATEALGWVVLALSDCRASLSSRVAECDDSRSDRGSNGRVRARPFGGERSKCSGAVARRRGRDDGEKEIKDQRVCCQIREEREDAGWRRVESRKEKQNKKKKK